MALKMTVSTAPKVNRIANIVSVIRTAVFGLIEVDATSAIARDTHDLHKAEGVNMRETVMLELASVSTEHCWTDGEIKAASKIVAQNKGNIALPNAVCTFVSEARTAMHPLVRVHIRNIVAMRDVAWDNETAALEMDKKSPRPLRDAFSRRYHLLGALMREAADGNLCDSPEEIVVWAKTRDPSQDHAKVAKKIETMREQLEEVMRTFNDPDIETAFDMLGKVTEITLRGAIGLPVVAKKTTTKSGFAVKQPTATVMEIAVGVVDVDALMDGVGAVH